MLIQLWLFGQKQVDSGILLIFMGAFCSQKRIYLIEGGGVARAPSLYARIFLPQWHLG